MEVAIHSKSSPAIAAAGQEFVRNNLTPEALSCYWYGALQRYGELYFMEETEAQRKKRNDAKRDVDKKSVKVHVAKAKKG